jgi:hypothetical protein
MTVYKLQGNKEFDLEVVGEANYMENFEAICGPRTPKGESRLIEAHLIREPDNPFDKNAVRVEVQNKLVGYLSRDNAKDLNVIYTGLKLPPDTIIAVNGQIRGGWKRSNGDEGNYGVWLDFPADERGAAQFKAIQQTPKQPKAKDPIMDIIGRTWRSGRNGKLKLLGIVSAVFFICCILPALLPNR